jgi:hypothetical protein
MATARALLLASKVLSLPATPSQSLGDMAVHGCGHLPDEQAFSRPVVLLNCCMRGVQLIQGLLPHLPPVELKQKGSASTGTAPALLPGALHKLLQQAAACLKALGSALAPGAARPGSTRLGYSDDKLAEFPATPAAPFQSDTDTRSNDQSCGTAASSSSSSGGGSAPSLLRTLALTVLSHLPSVKVCGNPECVVLAELSERELCVRQCGACGMTTAYCSKSCCQAHRKSHKRLCNRLAAAAAVDTAGH